MSVSGTVSAFAILHGAVEPGVRAGQAAVPGLRRAAEYACGPIGELLPAVGSGFRRLSLSMPGGQGHLAGNSCRDPV